MRLGSLAAGRPRPLVSLRSLDDVLLSLPWELLHHDGRFLVRDGVVDLATTRQRMPDKPAEVFVSPDGVAKTALNLVKQDKTAWSFEVETRPFGERW